MGGGKPVFWFSLIVSLQSGALDLSATAPPLAGPEVETIKPFAASKEKENSLEMKNDFGTFAADLETFLSLVVKKVFLNSFSQF